MKKFIAMFAIATSLVACREYVEEVVEETSVDTTVVDSTTLEVEVEVVEESAE